jgi:CHAT domain-containing protein
MEHAASAALAQELDNATTVAYPFIALTALLVLIAACTQRSSVCESLVKEARRLQDAGHYAEAIAQADKGLLGCRAEPPKRYWQFRLLKAQALTELGKYSDALDAIESDPPRGPEFADLRAHRLLDAAWVYFRLGDYDRAAQQLNDADSQAKSGGHPDPDRLRDIAYRKLYVDASRGDFDSARRTFERIRSLQGDPNDPYLLGAYGYLLLRAARYEEAAQYFEAALPAKVASGNPVELAAFYNNLGAIYYNLGDLDRALDYLQRAEPLLRKGGDDSGLRLCLNTIGLIHKDHSEYPQAIDYLKRALDLAIRVKEDDSRAQVLHNLAEACIGGKDWARAQTYNQQALEIERRRTNAEAEFNSRVDEARIRDGRGDLSGALATLDALTAQSTVNPAPRIDAEKEYIAIYRQRRDHPNAGKHYQAALGISSRFRSQLLQNENKLAWLSAQNAVNQEWVRFLVETDSRDEALEAAEASRARLMNERLSRTSGRPATLRDAASYRRLARARGAVLVSYWLTPDFSYAWIVKPDEIVLRKLPGELRIQALVAAYRGFLEDGEDPLHSDATAGTLLREAVLDPILPDLAGANRVILVPDGPLHALNFETLVVNGHYWIDDVTLSIAPSLNILSAGAESRPPRDATLLAIGDAQPVPDFPKLPNAGREMDALAGLFPNRATVLRAALATPAAYLGSPGAVYIHFAAHASASAERPLESAVILSPGPASGDGRLTARALLEKPVHAELVTISACRSAGVRAYHGEGLVGFAWVFLQTGAHGVIAGLWDASDDSTARLMANLYVGITHGDSPGEALRKAKLDLIHGGGRFSHPFYWAPFQYYVGQAPGRVAKTHP